jgi:hypothetical protein
MSWIPNSTLAASILPTNSTGGLNAYLQRTSTGDLTWVTGTSLLTDALPSGNGFLTKNSDGTYSLTAVNTIATKNDLSGLTVSSGYTLPTASTSVLGGVKIDGTTITISSGVISAVSSSSYSLPTASTSVLGGVKVDGTTISISSGVISAASTGIGLGIGQTWQDVTLTRTVGTVYTNTTGKPIMVMINAEGARISGSFTIGTTINKVIANIDWSQSYTFVVPDQTTYSFSLGGGTTGFFWIELR